VSGNQAELAILGTNMKKVELKGSIATVLGEALDKPIEYTVSVEHFSSWSEAVAAGEDLSDKEKLAVVNGRISASAKASKNQELTKELADKIKDTPDFKLRSLVKDIMAKNPKLSAEKARAAAESILALE
jgi:hypothetical protein